MERPIEGVKKGVKGEREGEARQEMGVEVDRRRVEL